MTITNVVHLGVLDDPYQVYSTRERRFWVDFDDGTHEVLTRRVALRFPMAPQERLKLQLAGLFGRWVMKRDRA